MDIFAQPIPYIVVAAVVTLIGVIYTVNKTNQTKLMEIEEARRIKKEDLERSEKKEREQELREYRQQLAAIRAHFTIGNMQAMSLSQDEIASINASFNTVVTDMRRMKASPQLNSDRTQRSLDTLEAQAGNFRDTLTSKSLNRNSGQNEAADAHLATANRIIGVAHVEIDEITETLRNM